MLKSLTKLCLLEELAQREKHSCCVVASRLEPNWAKVEFYWANSSFFVAQLWAAQPTPDTDGTTCFQTRSVRQ
jgi:hypothetical protein